MILSVMNGLRARDGQVTVWRGACLSSSEERIETQKLSESQEQKKEKKIVFLVKKDQYL